ALLPPALALPWSPFMHATWAGVALPGALLLYRDRRSRAALAAILLVATPWNEIFKFFPGLDGTTSLHYRSDPRPHELASDVWRAFVDAFARGEPRPAWLVASMKLPILAGFAALTVAAARAAIGSATETRPDVNARARLADDTDNRRFSGAVRLPELP
ncbi:MAG: hypothetical protein IAI48_06555, partial [Candidatus Eremiobacteraeota bacterium]|nr:hypothetical protein [Candidatus Eremiobacteraeota bacterium]